MSRKLIAVILGVLIGVPVLYFGSTVLFMTSGSNAMEDVGDNSNVASCEAIKTNQCMSGSVSESHYPDSCFQNGEHVLDNPYQCSN